MDDNITGTIDNFEQLRPGTGISIDDKTKYEYGADLSTEGTPLIDPGIGKTVTIRVFDFKMNPDKERIFPTDKQLIFNQHAKQISTILWGDGLIPLESVSPRVIVNKGQGKYKIFIPCEARSNTLFIDRPKSLSEQLKNGTTRH